MKRSFLTLVSLCLLLSVQAQDLPMIRSNTDVVDIRDGDQWRRGTWKLSSALKPDVYVTVIDTPKTMAYYTDIDSIFFRVEPGQSYDFIILLNGTDSCYQRIKARENRPHAQFSSEYIRKHRGEYHVEVPEVQELAHIIMALTPTGLADSIIVNHHGAYYQRVINHFGEYRDEPIVRSFEDILRFGNYARLKMDACGYFYRNDSIVKDQAYDRLNWGPNNYIESEVAEMERFAEKTGFREFYRENQDYYTYLVSLMEEQVPIPKMWTWAEERFPSRYDHYRITFSPLAYGAHSTNRFETDGFMQTVMFVSGPIENSEHPEKVQEGFMSRLVFTEIDHNYVNPVSDQYLERINEVFADRDKWAEDGSSADHYQGSYPVFNEYMTWAVFSLYALDNFSKADFAVINERVETQMAEWRGFCRFKSFNREVIRLYQAQETGQSIADLYPAVLDWCADQ